MPTSRLVHVITRNVSRDGSLPTRHPICLDHSCREARGGSSQSHGALGIDITEDVGCVVAQRLQSKCRRPGIDARRCLKSMEVRAAAEIWVAGGVGKEPKSAMKPRRALSKRVRGRAGVRLPVVTRRSHTENFGERQVLPYIAELSEVFVQGSAGARRLPWRL
jgi:hypothetical protein